MLETVAQLDLQNLKDITAQDIARQAKEQAAPPKVVHATINGSEMDLIEDVWLFEFAPFDRKTKDHDNRFAFNRIRGYYTPVLSDEATWAEHLEYKPVYLYFDSSLEIDENKFLPRKYYLNEIFSRPETDPIGLGAFCVYCRKEDIDLIVEKMEHAMSRVFDHLKSDTLDGLEYFQSNKEEFM